MRDGPDAVMIFAAGFGTRMGALTATRPKPLIPVAGITLLDRALAKAEAAGVGRRVVNLHYLPDQLRAHLAGRPDVALSVEPEILETGGGLRQALPLLGEGPVFTLNPDVVWTGRNPLRQLAARWDPREMDALLLLVARDNARSHVGAGDFLVDSAGRLTRGAGHVYAGAQIIKTEGLAGIPDKVFSLNRLWDTLISQKRAFGILHDGEWCDVGRPEGIAQAETMLREAGDV